MTYVYDMTVLKFQLETDDYAITAVLGLMFAVHYRRFQSLDKMLFLTLVETRAPTLRLLQRIRSQEPSLREG